MKIKPITKKVKTFTCDIYIGRKEGYDGVILDSTEAINWLQKYCDEVGFAVTVIRVDYIYTGGNEPGWRVGLINYPRFPKTQDEILEHGIKIAKNLLKILKQKRCSIVCSDYTYLIEGENMKIGTRLATKDGRKTGNGIIIDKYMSRWGFEVFVIKTDFGNLAQFTRDDIHRNFWIFEEGSLAMPRHPDDVNNWMVGRIRLLFRGINLWQFMKGLIFNDSYKK